VITIHPPVCRKCDIALRSFTALAGEMPGSRRHYARGLCSTCGPRERRAGTLVDWPRLIRLGVDVLEDLEVWRARLPDEPLRVIAQQMGMSYAALDQVLVRARRRGVEIR
jgi:hypothetical protein